MKFLGDFSMLDSLNTLSTREKDELKLSVPQLAAKIQDLVDHKIHWGEKLQSEEFAAGRYSWRLRIRYSGSEKTRPSSKNSSKFYGSTAFLSSLIVWIELR
jgi:hypothetical protein